MRVLLLQRRGRAHTSTILRSVWLLLVRGAGGQNVGLYIGESRTGMVCLVATHFNRRGPIRYLKNFPSGTLDIRAYAVY